METQRYECNQKAKQRFSCLCDRTNNLILKAFSPNGFYKQRCFARQNRIIKYNCHHDNHRVTQLWLTGSPVCKKKKRGTKSSYWVPSHYFFQIKKDYLTAIKWDLEEHSNLIHSVKNMWPLVVAGVDCTSAVSVCVCARAASSKRAPLLVVGVETSHVLKYVSCVKKVSETVELLSLSQVSHFNWMPRLYWHLLKTSTVCYWEPTKNWCVWFWRTFKETDWHLSHWSTVIHFILFLSAHNTLKMCVTLMFSLFFFTGLVGFLLDT